MTGGFGTNTNTMIASMADFDGNIYALTRNLSSGSEVWRSPNGEIWTKVVSGGLGNPENKHAAMD